MSRDEVIRFGLEAAKDEYARSQARLALVETKASLVAVTVEILLALLVALAEHLPYVGAGGSILWLATVGALLVSLMLSLAASVLVELSTPRRAGGLCRGVGPTRNEQMCFASSTDQGSRQRPASTRLSNVRLMPGPN